eukprot:1339743-Rhodomonas_salina.1
MGEKFEAPVWPSRLAPSPTAAYAGPAIGPYAPVSTKFCGRAVGPDLVGGTVWDWYNARVAEGELHRRGKVQEGYLRGYRTRGLLRSNFRYGTTLRGTSCRTARPPPGTPASVPAAVYHLRGGHTAEFAIRIGHVATSVLDTHDCYINIWDV